MHRSRPHARLVAAGLAAALAANLPAASAAQHPGPSAADSTVNRPAGRAGAGDTSAFRRVDLPAPTLMRTAAGAPGPAYWQQRADYVIRATLDTARRVISGEEWITYTNNSPDTLRYLWLQLDQNLFRADSRGAAIFDRSGRFGTAGADAGITLHRVAEPAPRRRGAAVALPHVVNGTLMRVDLPRPLPPRGRQRLEIAWSFPLGGFGADRMGLELVDGAVIYEIAQWYPRLAVYDDVAGWNTDQYLGQGEFYLEYGSFDVSLTVPAEMLVAATGTLRNPAEVLTPVQRARLARARESDSTVAIRALDEVADPATRPPAPAGTLTWRFTADSVRDFAWAAARHFVWDAARVNGGRTLAMSFYPPSADSIWREATQYAKTAIESYSAQWYPYPYPYAVNVNGPVGGMEYPMIVFCANRVSPQALYSVTDHEFGHTWFPMLVGNNERTDGWLDEGLNAFMNHYNWPKRWPADPIPPSRGTIPPYVANALSGTEQPISTPADRMKSTDNWRQGLYNKPALGLVLLRDRIVGAERFDPAFREYIRRWAYKHPTPADFFRTIEDGVGEDLGWLWRSWFGTTETLDQAIDSVTVSDSAGVTSRLHLRNVGAMPMPVELEVRREGGGSERVKLPVEVWFGGDRHAAAVPGRVIGVTVDPEEAYPDVDRSNNRWEAPAATPQP